MTYHTISYGVLYYSLRRITLFFTMYHTIFYDVLYHFSQRIMKSETSPFHNPVSACEASDAGIKGVNLFFDPSGVAQQRVNSLTERK